MNEIIKSIKNIELCTTYKTTQYKYYADDAILFVDSENDF